MGNAHPHQNAAEKSEREQVKNMVIANHKKGFDDIQKALVANSMQVSIYTGGPSLISITETAKEQLDRGGAAFTKNDLIAIAIAIKPIPNEKLSLLKTSTVADLNAYIRSVVYDPTRMIAAVNPQQHHTQPVGYNTHNQYQHAQTQQKEFLSLQISEPDWRVTKNNTERSLITY